MRLFSTICLFIIGLSNFASAETIYGIIKGNDNKKALPGASVRIVGTPRGTYANNYGMFKLILNNNEKELLVKSLGYKSKTVNINSLTDTLKIYLEPARVVSGTAVVYGDIEPHTLIERAIARKQENSKKIKTVQGKLQTKLFADGTESFSSSSTNETSSMTVTFSSGDDEKEKPAKVLMESISMTYIDKEENINHSHIISRRQTKNIPNEVNQIVVNDFINFYNDRIDLLNTKIVSPLADDAFDYYNFEIVEKEMLDGKYIYIVNVKPSTTLYPTFNGTIMISEGDYDFVGADLTPSSHTALPFLKDIRMVEKFEKYDENLWYPNYLQFETRVDMDVIAGAYNLSIDFSATRIYSDLKLNEPLPDSLYRKTINRITVSPLADSTTNEYWRENSLFTNSEEDEKIYAEIDSLVAENDSLQHEHNWAFNIVPYIDFNRASDVSYGLTPSINFKDAALEYTGFYSTGLDEFLSTVTYNQLYYTNEFTFQGSAEYFQGIGTFSEDKTTPAWLNTLQAGIFGKDYYDYYREEGYRFSLGIGYKSLSLGLGYQNSSQESIGVNTSNYLFGDKDWRANPDITSTEFQIVNYSLSWGNQGFLGLGSPYFLRVYGTFGNDKDMDKSFNTFHAEGRAALPIYETGYKPIELTVAAQAAIASEDTPIQYQLRLQNNVIFQNSMFGLYSAPIAMYGGKELYSSNVTLDFSDFLWRALGLPVYNGRGIDVALIGSVAYTYSDKQNYYMETGAKGYLETGFHIGRIPTFFSDVMFLGFDFRKQIDGSNTGWGLSISSPF